MRGSKGVLRGLLNKDDPWDVSKEGLHLKTSFIERERRYETFYREITYKTSSAIISKKSSIQRRFIL